MDTAQLATKTEPHVFDRLNLAPVGGCDCFARQFDFLRPAITASPVTRIASPTNIEAMSGDRRKADPSADHSLVIDCHGHYTTEPQELFDWRKRQIDAIGDRSQAPSIESFKVSDDRLRETVEGAQLRLQRERGTSLTLLSPRASSMGHHIGDAEVSSAWSRLSNDLIHRLTQLYPKNFSGVCQLPQSKGVEPKNCIPELVRCVNELGFVGCNLNPDPSGGFWTDPPLTDRWWYPLYEKMVELEVPAMVHVSAAANRAFHTTGSHYINGDTTAFMQFMLSDIFKDFPTLKFVIPHGGGAIPYHWGRYRGIAQDQKRPPLSELVLKNVFFDTCVYHQAGIDLLTRVIPAENILFASEMVGAVKGIDPETGFNFDDTRRYIDSSPFLTPQQKHAIFAGNVKRVYSRIPAGTFG
jgi:4-oxalmesaconate hydratase